MKLSDLKTNQDLITDRVATDPAFRAEWERTALARAVALEVVRYRSANGLSQRELAEMLLMKQPQVARIERGDTTPSIPTLSRLASVLDVEFTLDIRPSNRKATLITKRAQEQDAVASYESEGVAVLLAAA